MNFKTHLIYNIMATAVATAIASMSVVYALIGHDPTAVVKNLFVIFSAWCSIITIIAALYSTIRIANFNLSQSVDNVVQITVASGIAFFSLIFALAFVMGILITSI